MTAISKKKMISKTTNSTINRMMTMKNKSKTKMKMDIRKRKVKKLTKRKLIKIYANKNCKRQNSFLLIRK